MAASTNLTLQDLMDPANLIRLFKKGESMDAILKVLSSCDQTSLTQPLPDGSSLLHSFAMIGCYDIVKLLWEKGARPSILKKDSSTVLHSTVRTQDSEDLERAKILGLFLSSEEDNSMPINCKCSKGWTALKLAARRNLEQCVEVLLERGADPDVADEEGYTPLHNAIGNPDVLKLLAIKSSNINAQNQAGDTPLFVACERGLVDSALSLLEYKANPNIGNNQGITPLFVAAKVGHLELVKALVRRGADISSQGTAQNITPLHWAAHKENKAIALLLIEHGADVLKCDREGRTPLAMASPELAAKMIAAAQRVTPSLSLPETTHPSMSVSDKAIAVCCGGNVQALQALVQSGMSVNFSREDTGTSLLHMAAYYGQLHVVVYLMQQGASWRAADKEGDIVLHYACMKDVGSQGMHGETLKFLLSSPAGMLRNTQNGSGETPIMLAIGGRFMPRVRLLLQHNADVTIPNHKGELPLHRACNSIDSIEALFHFAELTSDLNIQDTDGRTPLMFAVRSGHTPLVKYLLQRGADPNIQQTDGFTALHLIVQGESEALCRLLLIGGADPCIAGGTGKWSPLHIAAHRNSRAVCQLLVEYGADINQRNNEGDSPLSLTGSAELKQSMTMLYTQRQEQLEVSTADNESASTTPIHKATPTKKEDDLSMEARVERVGGSEESGADEGSDSEAVLTRQGTFSKENESGSFEGDTVPQTRHQEALQEINTLQQSLNEAQNDLAAAKEDTRQLFCHNQVLSDELKWLETWMVAHHVESSLSLQESDREGEKKESGVCTLRHARWLICKLQIEQTGPLINTDETLGKFFDVYPGTYRQLPVAIKYVRGVERWGVDVYETFYQEIDVISQLQCPWLVQFMGCRLDPVKQQCIVITEYMARGSLHSILHVDKLDLEWDQRLGIVIDVCQGMVFLHSHDTLHRNLVPRNILIGQHFNAKVGDFGLWETQNVTNEIAQSHGDSPTQAPQMYMAPEASEKLEFTQAADVYSFGIVMYEAATGERPYSELDLSDDKPFLLTMKVIMGKRPVFPHCVPTAYQQVAERCWVGEPQDRPSFETVLRQLRAL